MHHILVMSVIFLQLWADILQLPLKFERLMDFIQLADAVLVHPQVGNGFLGGRGAVILFSDPHQYRVQLLSFLPGQLHSGLLFFRLFLSFAEQPFEQAEQWPSPPC